MNPTPTTHNKARIPIAIRPPISAGLRSGVLFEGVERGVSSRLVINRRGGREIDSRDEEVGRLRQKHSGTILEGIQTTDGGERGIKVMEP